MKKTRPLHSVLRQKFQGYFFRFLKVIVPVNISKDVIKDDIKRILIVRINYRIGNVLFITPIIQQLEDEFADAKVDILVGAGFTKTLFSGFKNVDKVFDFPRKKLKNPVELIRYINYLRSTKYDLVLNVNYGSSSDKTAILLSKSRYKVGFCQDDLFSAVTHCVEKKDGVLHASLKPLELMKALGKEPNYNYRMDIALSEEELLEGKRNLNSLIDGSSYKKVIAIFRNARWEKRLDDDWWRDLVVNLDKIDKDILVIDILSPDIKDVLNEGMLSYAEKDLRKLAAFMANLDGFVCADTGPMHLASASGVATYALFNSSDTDSYGPIGKRDKVIQISDMNILEVTKEIFSQLKV